MLANKLKVGWHVDFFRATERSALYIKGAIYVNKWDMRTHEVAYLLNPAFCGRILYSTIKKTYNEILNRAFPFPLIYLVLPLVLHKQTRINISSRTQLLVWVQKYSQLLIDFPRRTRELVPISNEAIEFLLQTGKIVLTPNGELEIVPHFSHSEQNKVCRFRSKRMPNKKLST